MLLDLNAVDFLLEDGVADQDPQQSVADVLVLLVAVHEVPEEEGEVEDEHEQSAGAQPEYLLGQAHLFHQGVGLDQFGGGEVEVCLVFTELELFVKDFKYALEEVVIKVLSLQVIFQGQVVILLRSLPLDGSSPLNDGLPGVQVAAEDAGDSRIKLIVENNRVESEIEDEASWWLFFN